jgi:hypothetical protein
MKALLVDILDRRYRCLRLELCTKLVPSKLSHQEKNPFWVGCVRRSPTQGSLDAQILASICKFYRVRDLHPNSRSLYPCECPNCIVYQYGRNLNTTQTLFANSDSTLYRYSHLGYTFSVYNVIHESIIFENIISSY